MTMPLSVRRSLPEGAITRVTSGAAVEDMRVRVLQHGVGVVGWAPAFAYGNVAHLSDDEWPDITRIEATHLALAAQLEPKVNHVWCCDVRAPAVREALVGVFRLPMAFVAHGLREALLVNLALGLPLPTNSWCTREAARLRVQGRHHHRYIDPSGSPGSRRLALVALERAISLSATVKSIRAQCHWRPGDELNLERAARRAILAGEPESAAQLASARALVVLKCHARWLPIWPAAASFSTSRSGCFLRSGPSHRLSGAALVWMGRPGTAFSLTPGSRRFASRSTCPGPDSPLRERMTLPTGYSTRSECLPQRTPWTARC